MFVTWSTLQFRKQHPELFEKGDYIPIAIAGQKREHVCAFARGWNDRRVVVIAPRLIYGLAGGELVGPMGGLWGNTALEAEVQGLNNVFTGEAIIGNRLADILKTFPIALLARQS